MPVSPQLLGVFFFFYLNFSIRSKSRSYFLTSHTFQASQEIVAHRHSPPLTSWSSGVSFPSLWSKQAHYGKDRSHGWRETGPTLSHHGTEAPSTALRLSAGHHIEVFFYQNLPRRSERNRLLWVLFIQRPVVNQLQHQSRGKERATKRRCTVDWDAASERTTRKGRRGGGEVWMRKENSWVKHTHTHIWLTWINWLHTSTSQCTVQHYFYKSKT